MSRPNPTSLSTQRRKDAELDFPDLDFNRFVISQFLLLHGGLGHAFRS